MGQRGSPRIIDHPDPCRRRRRRKGWLTAVLTVSAMLSVALTPVTAAAAGVATYTATETIPVPPASTYAGSGGGDGWAVALTPTAVYNVFHHQMTLQVACHLQSDASPCWGTRTITDADGNAFATSGHPGMWIDPGTEKLYVFATRVSSRSGGVVCVDTKQAATVADPFCGFTELSGPGDSPADFYGALSAPALVGSKWYAVNYSSDGTANSGTKNTMLCFDTSSLSACGSQPYAIDVGSGIPNSPTWPSPVTAAIGTRVLVPMRLDSADKLGCFDTTTHASCAGSWPMSLGVSYIAANGAAFPMTDSAGTITGFCLPTGVDPCFGLDGSPTATPPGMAGVLTYTDVWNGPAFTLGPRVYVANGNVDRVQCYDYSTHASCANFPRSFANLGYIYTTNPDPQRPDCIWVNADYGSGQIQNFDAYGAGACGQGPVRVLAAHIVAPSVLCTPLTYTSLQVTAPAPGTYTNGSVAFLDGDGTAIASAADRPLDASGTVPLDGLALNTATGLPQFLITLAGASATGSVTVKLTWTGTPDPACVKPGITVTPQGPDTAFIAMGDSYSAGEGNAPYIPPSDSDLNRCHRSAIAYGPRLSQLHWTKPPTPNFVACSGAITDDLFNPNRELNLLPGLGVGRKALEPPQLSALTQDTTLVTLTIGGNDIGFVDVLGGCVSNPGLEGDRHCQNSSLAPTVAKRLNALNGVGVSATPTNYPIHAWVDIIRKIHERSPNARILIAGYPVLIDPNGAFQKDAKGEQFCLVGGLSWYGHRVGWSAAVYRDEAEWMSVVAGRVNSGIRQAVAKSGVPLASYVDVSSSFSGHALCDRNPWLYPLSGNVNVTGDIKTPWSGSFHPTAEGQAAYEAAFARTLG
jgi:hypothetical protein